MATIAFSADGNGGIVTQPASAGERIIVRSASASDTSQTITLYGEVSSSPSSEAETLAGKIEQMTAASFETLDAINLSGAAAGTLSIYGEGTAATGDVRLDTNVTESDILDLGLSSDYQTYTFVNPEITTVECVADSGGSLNQKYFRIYDSAGSVGVWIDVDNSGSAAPAGVSGDDRTIEVTGVATGDTAAAVATAVAAALDADGQFHAGASDDTVTVYDATGGTRTDAGAGDSGFTVTVIDQGSALSTDDILIGRTATETAANIAAVINLSGSTGLTGGSTVANAYFSATADTQVVTITDRIPVSRSLAYETSGTSSFSVRIPTGGVSGTLLTTITAGVTDQYNSISFANLDLSASNLPPGITVVSDWIRVYGKRWNIHVRSDFSLANIDSGELGVDFSHDASTVVEHRHWAITGTGYDRFSIEDADAAAATRDTRYEYVRLNFANANSAAQALDARITFDG